VTSLFGWLAKPLGKYITTYSLIYGLIGLALAVECWWHVVIPDLDELGWKTAGASLAVLAPFAITAYLRPWSRRGRTSNQGET